MGHHRIKCPDCGRDFPWSKRRKPRGGDGTFFYPPIHMDWTDMESCLGSFAEGVWIEGTANHLHQLSQDR